MAKPQVPTPSLMPAIGPRRTFRPASVISAYEVCPLCGINRDYTDNTLRHLMRDHAIDLGGEDLESAYRAAVKVTSCATTLKSNGLKIATLKDLLLLPSVENATKKEEVLTAMQEGKTAIFNSSDILRYPVEVLPPVRNPTESTDQQKSEALKYAKQKDNPQCREEVSMGAQEAMNYMTFIASFLCPHRVYPCMNCAYIKDFKCAH